MTRIELVSSSQSPVMARAAWTLGARGGNRFIDRGSPGSSPPVVLFRDLPQTGSRGRR